MFKTLERIELLVSKILYSDQYSYKWIITKDFYLEIEIYSYKWIITKDFNLEIEISFYLRDHRTHFDFFYYSDLYFIISVTYYCKDFQILIPT